MEAVLVHRGIEFAMNRKTHLLPTLAPSLIADLPAHEHDAAVAEVVVGLARRPGTCTPAVGLNHVEQSRFLPSLGRDQTEGEWIVMPVSAARCAILTRCQQTSAAKSH